MLNQTHLLTVCIIGSGDQDALIDLRQADRYCVVQPDKCCPSRQLASKGTEVDNNCQLGCQCQSQGGLGLVGLAKRDLSTVGVKCPQC